MPLIGSELLLQLVTGENPDKAQHAGELITKYKENELTLPDYVVAELADTLEYQEPYHWPREAVCEALEDIVVIPQCKVSTGVEQALRLYRKQPKSTFAQCLLAAQAKLQRTYVVIL